VSVAHPGGFSVAVYGLKVQKNTFAIWESIPMLQSMLSRLYTRLVREKLGKYPAVAILGPR